MADICGTTGLRTAGYLPAMLVVLLAGCGSSGRDASPDPDPPDPAPDPPPVVETGRFSAVEGDAGDVTLAVPVALSAAADGDATVDFATENGSAEAGADFNAISGTLTFASGTTSQTLNVAVHGDSLHERDEEFTIRFSNPSGNIRLVDTASTATIINNDGPPEVSISDAIIAEGSGGTDTISFDVSLSAVSGIDARVLFATADDTAIAPDDYVSSSGTLVIPAGSSSASIDVSIIGDIAVEPNETFGVSLSSPVDATIGAGNATGTIVDDDNFPIVGTGNFQVTEGDAGNVVLAIPVSLSIPASGTASIDFATENVTAVAPADFDATAGTLTFPQGVTSQTINVNVRGDVFYESDESFIVRFSNPSSNIGLAADTSTGTIVDDDNPPLITISDAQLAEGDAGGNTLGFTVALSAVSGLQTSVDFATADGTATAGSDYQQANGTLVIPAGGTVGTIDVTVNGDIASEADETFIVTLSNPLNGAISAGAATGTIVDDDVQPVIETGTFEISESDAGDVTLSIPVSLSTAAAGDATVDYSTVDGTATSPGDFDAASGTLTFPQGTLQRTVDITVHGDSIFEADEEFTLQFTNPSANISVVGDSTGRILNDDTVPSVSVADANADEGDAGTATFGFSVTLSEASGVDAGVDYATSDGTATAGDDYVATSGTIIIAAGDTGATVDIELIGDTVLETDETFTLTLSNPSDATVATGTATITIVDNDTQPAVDPGTFDISESDTGDIVFSVPVTLSAAASGTATVDYATVAGTASAPDDYDSVSGTLSFPQGTTQQTVDITIHGDTLFERDESLTLQFSNPSANIRVVGDSTVRLLNDDTAPSLSVADASADEGDNGNTAVGFSVTLSEASGVDASVDFATSDGSATAGDDYVATNGTIVIAAGDTSADVDVNLIGDTDLETDETFTLTLSNPTDATIVTGSATGTILNDDLFQPGLDTRPDNQTCVAPQLPQGGTSTYDLVDAFQQLPSFNQPTKILVEPIANPRWFVLQKNGELRVFDPDVATGSTLYLDIAVNDAGEGGLLGMAFHPDYPGVPEVFIYYTRNHSNPSMRSVISRFILDDVQSPGPGTVEQVILEIDQNASNHNGGDIDFGADRMLYIGLGDGGGSGDSLNRGQDTTRLLGAMLRIDVLGPGVSFPGNPYDIPQDNPFAGNAECGPAGNANACPEIYAWGFRNPWRWAFDPPTGNLWLADVGEGSWEEVDVVDRGGNYGWRCREGAHNFNTSGCNGTYIDPVFEYPHANGDRSITGGYVYRGSALPSLAGRYVFGDFWSGRIWALESDGQGGYTSEELVTGPVAGPSAFGVDENGELYVTDLSNGRILALVSGGGGQDPVPDLLSDSGCVDPGDIKQPYDGLIPYDINAPFWSDGALKDRLIGLPNGTTISIDGADDWDFPDGTVLVKNFRRGGRLIETRHLMRHPGGTWAGYTYEWDANETEATRVRGGKTVQIDGDDWIFPDEAACLQCHTTVAGVSLGAETAQLNKDFTYPSTQRTSNQLATLDHILAFTSPLPGPPDTLPALADPQDSSASLDDRARAYLHTNCSQCHRQNGPTSVTMDLRYTTPLSSTDACDALPQAGDLGLTNARIIAPGDASRSVLVERVSRRDIFGMPPLGSAMADGDGVTLLTDWINGLTNCN